MSKLLGHTIRDQLSFQLQFTILRMPLCKNVPKKLSQMLSKGIFLHKEHDSLKVLSTTRKTIFYSLVYGILGIKIGRKGCKGLFSKIWILILDGQILMPFLLFMPSKYP